MNMTQGAAHYGKVLCKSKDKPAVNLAMPDNYAIAIGAFDFSEFNGLVCRSDESVNFLKCA